VRAYYITHGVHAWHALDRGGVTYLHDAHLDLVQILDERVHRRNQRLQHKLFTEWLTSLHGISSTERNQRLQHTQYTESAPATHRLRNGLHPYTESAALNGISACNTRTARNQRLQHTVYGMVYITTRNQQHCTESALATHRLRMIYRFTHSAVYGMGTYYATNIAYTAYATNITYKESTPATHAVQDNRYKEGGWKWAFRR
jgi:hypothetical protein